MCNLSRCGLRALLATMAPAGSSSILPSLIRTFSTIPDPDPEESVLYSQQLQHPNFIHPVSISHLDSLCRNPSLQRLVNSAAFLKSQLPARLQNHIHRLQALPQPVNPHLAELLATTIDSKAQGLEVSRDWKLVPTDDLQGLSHLEAHLAAFRQHLEVEVGKLTTTAQSLTENSHWWDNKKQVRWLNRLLDLCHWYLLSTRVMLTQHSAALTALTNNSSSSSSSQAPAASHSTVAHYHEPGHASTAINQPYTPPHQQLALQGAPVSLVTRNAPVRELVQDMAEDCRAFCIEKNSAAPDVNIVGGHRLTATMVVPYVEFVLTEVLKNAMQAVIARYGAWDVDDAEPVLVEICQVPGSAVISSSMDGSSRGADKAGSSTSQGSFIQVVVTDVGHGIPAGQAQHMYDYFWSNNRASNTLYGYSRNHGSPFQGIGVGVPMARVYTHFMGGSIEWETDSWKRHTTVTVNLPKHGFTF